MVVSVKAAGADLTLGAPAGLLPGGALGGSFAGIASGSRTYGVSADNRFLLQFNPGFTTGLRRGRGFSAADPVTRPEVGTSPGGITLILNWLGSRGR